MNQSGLIKEYTSPSGKVAAHNTHLGGLSNYCGSGPAICFYASISTGCVYCVLFPNSVLGLLVGADDLFSNFLGVPTQRKHPKLAIVMPLPCTQILDFELRAAPGGEFWVVSLGEGCGELLHAWEMWLSPHSEKPVGSEVGGQDPCPWIGSPVGNQACIVHRLL